MTEPDKIAVNPSVSKILKKLFLSSRISLAAWLTLCFFLCAPFVLTAAGGESPVPAIKPVKALNYKLSLFLYPEKHTISGEVEIKISFSPDFTGEVTMNLNRDMEARFVKLLPGGRGVNFKKNGDTLFFETRDTFESILVSFYGDPSVYITEKNSFTYIGKEGCYFDDLCFYFPRFGIEDRSLFELSAAVPNDWVIVTQGNLISKEACSENSLYTVYKFKNDRQARCHTLAAGPYIERRAGGIQKTVSSGFSGEVILSVTDEKVPVVNEADFDIRAFFFSDDRSYADAYCDEASRILKFYRMNYGAIETKKLNIVEIEKVFPGGYGPEEVIYITAAAVNGGRSGGKTPVDSELLSHEIAHQWFGNFVSAEFPRSNFLNEAFATYASMQYLKSKSNNAFRRQSEEYIRRYQIYRIFSGTGEISIADACALGRVPAYQEIVYYRGAFVLSLILEKISGLSKISPARIIEKYVEKYKNKTVTVEEFKAFALNVNKGLYDFTPEESDLKKIAAVFDNYYNGTAAVEVSFKKAELIDDPLDASGTVCRVTLDRTGEMTGETAVSVALLEKGAVKKYKLDIARGEKTYDIKCDSKPSSLSIDPDREGIVLTPVPALKAMSHKDGAVVIYGSSSMSAKVNSFMREYAGTISASPFMDCAIDEKDALEHSNLIIIGTPGNNSILKKLSGRLPFKYLKYSVSSPGIRSFYDENYSLAYVISNPFYENGTITVISFETDISLNHVSKLNRNLNDYAIYLPSQNLLMTDNFPQTGLYPVSVKKSDGDKENSGLKLISASVGFENTVIDNKINALFLGVQGHHLETASVSLVVSASQSLADRERPLMKKTVVIPPKALTELEFSFFLKAGQGKQLFVDLLDEKGAVISSTVLQYKSVYSSYIYLMPLSDGNSNPEMVMSTLGDIFAKRQSQFEMIRFNFNRLPSDPDALASISGIILNNFNFESSRSAKLKQSLINYAMNGGKVIISGYDFSSGGTGLVDAGLMEKIFAHKISASTNYNFGNDDQAGFQNLSAARPPAPVIIHGQSPKTVPGELKNSLRGRVERIFDDSLVRSFIGKGFFYYIPYDFTAPRIRRSELNEKVMTSVFISKSKWREPLIDWQRLSPGFVFKEGDNITGIRIEFFIVFMLVYIICLGPVLLAVLKEKFSTDNYFIGMGAVTMIFTFIIISWGLSMTRVFTSVSLVTIAEIPANYFGKVTCNNFFRVAAGSVSEVELYIPETDISASNTPQQYKTKISLDDEPGNKRIKVKITNPMRFVANTFSFSENNSKIDEQKSISIEALLETAEVSVKISAPCIAESAENGKFVSILRLPGGHRLFEASGPGIAARIEYGAMPVNSKISSTLDSCGFLNAADRDSVSQIFKYIDENEKYAASCVLVSVYHDAVSITVGGSEKKIPRTRITLSPFSLSIKPGSVIPSQAIFRYERSYYADKYTDFTVDLSDYKRYLSTGAYKGLTAVFKLKQRSGILPQGINLLQKQFVDSVHVSLNDLDLRAAQSQLTATIKNFNKYLNIDTADDYLTRFSLPVFKPPFNLLESEVSIICE